MLSNSHAKMLALDHVPADAAGAAEDALARFGALLTDERHAALELKRAEEHLGDTRERLERKQAERATLGRIFHRHERAALDTHVAGHESARSPTGRSASTTAKSSSA